MRATLVKNAEPALGDPNKCKYKGGMRLSISHCPMATADSAILDAFNGMALSM
ncbi:MAG: hypothetical protein R6V12_12555 [Candidatus Hydrogenedentota bacterium]